MTTRCVAKLFSVCRFTKYMPAEKVVASTLSRFALDVIFFVNINSPLVESILNCPETASFRITSKYSAVTEGLSSMIVLSISKSSVATAQLLQVLKQNKRVDSVELAPVSYTHLRAPRDQRGSRMPSSA